jgi:hypothetical protein
LAPWACDLRCRCGHGQRGRFPGRAGDAALAAPAAARQYLRVTWRGYFVADYASVAEVGRHVDLAALSPVDDA